MWKISPIASLTKIHIISPNILPEYSVFRPSGSRYYGSPCSEEFENDLVSDSHSPSGNNAHVSWERKK